MTTESKDFTRLHKRLRYFLFTSVILYVFSIILTLMYWGVSFSDQNWNYNSSYHAIIYGWSIAFLQAVGVGIAATVTVAIVRAKENIILTNQDPQILDRYDKLFPLGILLGILGMLPLIISFTGLVLSG
jgi:TRAP-type C4-dicarboxylate transport system permease small subunit